MLQYSPKITTDGLVMCLDASQNKSYPAADLPVKNGLVMWMDAADDTTFSYSSGTTVSQWRDKSGYNYHMVPKVNGPTRSVFLNSRKVLAFTAVQTIGNDVIDLSSTTSTVFVVSRYTSGTNQRVLTCNLDSGGGNWLLGHWGGYVNQYYAEGWVSYQVYGNDTVWRVYMGDYSGPPAGANTDLANIYSNGTAIVTNSTAASGGLRKLGINYYSNETSTCEVAEIIVFNRVLTVTERKQVNTYLGQKWGISNTDRSIVDLVGNNIGSFGGAAGSQTVANMPSFDVYNKGALRFDGTDDYVVGSVPSIAASSTVGMWIKSSNYDGKIPFSIAGATYGSGPNIFFFSGLINWNTGDGAGNPFSGGSYPDSNWHYIVVTNDAATNAKLYIDGVLIGTAAYRSTLSTNSNNLWLGRFSGDNNYTINANIAAAQLYNKVLSAVEVAQNYEAQKSKFANTIVQQGLVLNLDAGNPYSYAGAGTTWIDVSGNSNNGTLTNGPTYSSDVGGTIVFDGVNDYVTTSFATTSGQSVTYCGWVYSTESTSIYKNFVDSLSESPMIWWNASGQIEFDASRYTTTTVYRNQWVYVSLSKPSGSSSASYYVNGVLVGTGTAYTTPALIPTLFNRSAAQTWKGNGAVVQIYNRALSAAEVLQNYNATKGRFGL